MVDSAADPRQPEDWLKQLRQVPLVPSMTENLRQLKSIFAHNSDLNYRQITTPAGWQATVVFIDGMVKGELIDRDIIAPLLAQESRPDPQQIALAVTQVAGVKPVQCMGDLVSGLFDGQVVLLIDGVAQAVGYSLPGWKTRSISEPITEAGLRAPQEGFVETIRDNVVLLRRRLKTPAFKVEDIRVGTLSRTILSIVYLEGVVADELVTEMRCRLQRVQLDGVLESGHLDEIIADSPYSPFPQTQYTERPDVAAAQLLEGRVVVLTDGTPFALIAPALFTGFLQAGEDYYEHFYFGSFVRLIRYVAYFTALLLPAFYIALTTYHQEMIPTPLLITLMASREGVPFPALVEATLMEVVFELLREAGLRLPRPIGQAVSIVGALVIGDASVRAGVVSAPMLIVVAVTGISSFAIPRYNAGLSVRLLRFPLMVAAAMMGLIGVTGGLYLILAHLCALRSFGVPYLESIAPRSSAGLKDTLVRSPFWLLKKRPRFFGRPDPQRIGPGVQPQQPQGGSQQ